MKHVLVSDTHLGYKDGSDEYHNITINLFEQLIAFAKDNNIKSFIHGGDFFDCRRSISVKTIPVSFKIIKSLSNTFDDIHILLGNHDTYYKTSLVPSSLDMFIGFKGINIVNEVKVFNNIHLQPWLIEDFKPLSVSFCIGHFEMNGVPINRSNTISKGGLSIGQFKDYKKVISGHYHTISVTNNVFYIGSPFHMTFNDSDNRGFYVFDDSNGELEFIVFDDYPKFIIFNHKEIDYDIIEGNNIKVIVTEDISTAKLGLLSNTLNEKNPNQLHINFDITETEDKETLDESDAILDIRTIESKYLDSVELPEHIKRDILDEHLNNLWSGV